MSILKFKEGSNTTIKLDYENGKKVESKFKDREGNTQYQYMWSCNGGDDIIYASPSLNAMLQSETGNEEKGVEVNIKKVDSGNTDGEGRKILIFAVNDRTLEMRNKGIEADTSFENDKNVEITDEDIPF